MNDRVEVTQQTDPLRKQEWHFLYLDHALVLTAWVRLERKTTRHRNYEALESYNVYAQNKSDRNDEEVPLPDWVKEKAVEKFLESMKVGKWSEIRGKR